ncbi:MAG: Hsp20/alpha crystallin family protein [Acidimicrobiia bacterium]
MLVRTDPFAAQFAQLDRMADQLLGTRTSRPKTSPGWMAMDAIRREHSVELRFDVPGVAPEAIDLTVERQVLTVSADRSWSPSDGEEVLSSERARGSVSRQVMLGENLDLDHLEAAYEHGVLTVTIPVAAEAKPRKVEIRAASPAPEAIEA